MIKVMIIGAYGKLGTVACATLNENPDYNVIAKVGRDDDLLKMLQEHKPDIAIELTNIHSVFDNSCMLINNHVKTIIGASGLTPDQIETLSALSDKNATGCIIAPNFSIGAILMMNFASQAAKFFRDVEIIETHHQQKLDAPSGTAIKTAELIKQAKSTTLSSNSSDKKNQELYPGARGASVEDVNIHSLRLPGYIASQQVIFGGLGENLKIQHNSISRDCFGAGIKFACEQVQQINHLIYGLDNILNS